VERPSKEAWESWLKSGITQFYLTDLQDVREWFKEELVQGKAGLDHGLVGTIGICDGLQRAINLARSEFNYAGKENLEGEDENGN